MTKSKFSLKGFFFELFIIFIGVYGAFELNRYQDNQRERKVKLNYLTSFMAELNTVRSQTEQVKKQAARLISDLEAKWAAGEQPDLRPPNIYFNSALLITQIGLSDDVFVQLDASLASSLSGGYDLVERTSIRIKDFNDLCNRELIGHEPLEFYNRDGSLKPQYDWYLKGLRNIDTRLGLLLQIVDEVAMPGTKTLLEELN